MYTDFITRIRNAQKARLEYVKIPYSEMDLAIAELLTRQGFLENASKKGRMPKRIIEVKLKYSLGKGVIGGARLISKPSRRLYSGYRDLKPVKQGYGITVISTSKGIKTNKEARKEKLGGELLFEIW